MQELNVTQVEEVSGGLAMAVGVLILIYGYYKLSEYLAG